MRNINLIFSILIFSILNSQESLNMDLVGQLNYPQGTNDVWGYSNGSLEYALVGARNGFSVVDISCPSNPLEVFFISGSQSIWRDIKTWKNYAYVTTEAEDGLLIVDLNDPTGQSYIYTEQFFSTSHNIYIDENGFAYIFGADTGEGGAIILDLNNDPMNPVQVGIFDDYYLHDGMVRGDTLWGSAVYAGVFSIIDVSDKANPTILSSYPTSCDFTHNAWISDDNNYLFTTDEQSGCYIGSYDVSDIYNISEIDLIQDWTQSEVVVPHNTHVLGNYLVTSYYTSGITIVDASDPYNLEEVGYYDTSPLVGEDMEGCWGAYPYLPSGLILATDQAEGLFVLHSPLITSNDISFYLDQNNCPVYGCTDSLALNYDPLASISNGSCCYISGCMDISSTNYNPSACIDDGSCIFLILGCDNEDAINYNPSANASSAFLGPDNLYLGTGGWHDNDAWDMVFNCYETVNIKTIELIAESSFSTNIEILDNNLNQIYTNLISLSEGLNIIDIDYTIDPGINYRIGILGNNEGLYRNDNIASGVFPINLGDVIEITGNTTSSPQAYYYYFYNWQLEIPCEGISNMSSEINPSKIIYTFDIMSRDVNQNNLLLEIYDDGSVEKKFILK